MFLIGLWAAINGFCLFINGFSGTRSSDLKIIGGILTVILVFAIMFNLVMKGMILAVFMGIIILIAGIFTEIASFRLQ